MTKAELEILKKWSKLRTPEKNWKKFAVIAESVYISLNESDKRLMLDEFDGYIRDVKSGRIEASPVEIKIPVIKQ